MKKRYILRIRKVGTKQFRQRELSLTDEEADKLMSKLNVPDNGFVLIEMYPEQLN
jgi:hypothetical protein